MEGRHGEQLPLVVAQLRQVVVRIVLAWSPLLRRNLQQSHGNLNTGTRYNATSKMPYFFSSMKYASMQPTKIAVVIAQCKLITWSVPHGWDLDLNLDLFIEFEPDLLKLLNLII